MKAGFTLIAALAVTVAPLKAFAQAWVGSPDFSEGVGIRAGNLELHPSLGAEFGYDSNYFRAAESENPVQALKLRVTPSITLSTLGKERRNSTTPPNVVFNAGAYVSYFRLFPLDSADSEASKRSNASAGADAKLDLFPKGKLGFDLQANFARFIEGEGRTDDLAGEGYNRDTVRGGGGVTWRPGGGLFEWKLGYYATFNYFENEQFKSLQNLQHEVGTRGRWRFLPRSSLLFDSTYTFVRYSNLNAASQQTDGDIVRTRVGFHGLVTYHLALLGMIGWASTFYENRGAVQARQYDSPIANAEVRWFIQARPDLEQATVASGLSSIAVGYQRTVSNSYLNSFYQRDRGYLQFSMFILGAVAGGLEFGVSRVAFPETVAGGTAIPEFTETRLDGRLFGEYRLTDNFAVNASVMYDQNNSVVINTDDLSYSRWQAYLGLRYFW